MANSEKSSATADVCLIGLYLCRKFRALNLETKNPQMKIFRNTMNYPEILRKTD